MEKLLDLFVRFVQANWNHRYLRAYLGAAAVITAVVGICVLRFPVISIRYALGAEVLVTALLIANVVHHWLPRTKKNQIGFVIAIQGESQQESERVRRDFSEELKRQLASSQHVAPFHVMVLSPFQAAKLVDLPAAVACLKQCNAHFLVFGDMRTRNACGAPVHALRFQGMVTHAEIRLDVSRLLSNEMRAVLPLNVDVPSRDDLKGFEVTSAAFGAGAKFIVATAALVSGDINLAQRLLEELQAFARLDSDASRVARNERRSLRSLVPQRLADVYLARSQRGYLSWRRRRDDESLQECWDYIQKYDLLRPRTVQFFLTKAICTFVWTLNAERSLDILKNVPHPDRHGAHIKYAQAFLYAYKGSLTEAERLYRAAFRLDKSGEVGFEVEEFIGWVLSESPHLTQLKYCLGLLNFHLKKDVELAAVDFRSFAADPGSAIYAPQRAYAEEFIASHCARPKAANEEYVESNGRATNSAGRKA